MSSKVLRGHRVSAADRRPWLRSAAVEQSEPVANAPWETELDRDTSLSRLQRLRAEAAAAIEQARREGIELGRAQAREELDAEIEPLRRRLGEALSRFANLEATIRLETEDRMVDLALAIANHILRREISQDPTAIRDLARAALDRVQRRTLHQVRVHPVHEELLRSVMAVAVPGADVELVVDSTMQPGDLLFETERGELDASIETQLAELRRGFADTRSV